jgi:hypothetical protein
LTHRVNGSQGVEGQVYPAYLGSGSGGEFLADERFEGFHIAELVVVEPQAFGSELAVVTIRWLLTKNGLASVFSLCFCKQQREATK